MFEMEKRRGEHYRQYFDFSLDKVYKLEVRRENNKTIIDKKY